jgi:hypothetical protein
MSKKRKDSLTDEEKHAFCEHLKMGFSYSHAAEALKRNRSVFFALRRRDPAFEADVSAAVEAGSDTLEDEARRRAIEGIDEDQYYRGTVVGKVKRFSDVLLIFLLKGRRPDKFRDRQEIRHTGHTELADRLVAGRERLRKARDDVISDDDALLH